MKLMNLGFEQIIRSIQQLPAREQERVRQWLEETRSSHDNGKTSQAMTGHSEKCLRWLNENRQKYLGQWVALDGDRLIASAPTAKEVYSKAKAEGLKIPFVELVTQEEPAPFSGGWLS
jgi:hypothetical protein